MRGNYIVKHALCSSEKRGRRPTVVQRPPAQSSMLSLRREPQVQESDY